MKKKILILSLIVIFFSFIGLTSNALKDTPPEVDVEEIKTKMDVNNNFDGKTFMDGLYGNFYRIEVNKSTNNYDYIMRNVEICFASIQEKINGRNKIDFQYMRKNHVSTLD